MGEKHAILGLLVLCWMAATALTAESAGFEINGNSIEAIVVERDAEDFLQAAAEDLTRCIEKASGVSLPVVEDGGASRGATIQLGRTDLAHETGIKTGHVGVEGYAIVPKGRHLFIQGANPDGTVHGIYGFLHDSLGARWFLPGELGEVIPALSSPLTVRKRRVVPDFSYRFFSGIAGAEGRAWYIRNRLTRSRRDIPYWGFGHNLKHIFPVSKYGKDHPEYYAEINGKRFVPEIGQEEKGQPCFTNPDVIRITVEAARDFFDNNPTATQYSLCANDNTDHCTCPNCAALDLPAVHFYVPAWRTYSDSYFYYVEQVAKEIAQSHPGKTLGCYAYWGTKSIPRSIKRLPDNVVISLTQDTSQHFDPKYRAHDRSFQLGWSGVAAHVSKYDYYSLGWFTPRYFPHLAADDIKFSKKHGILGFYIEACTYRAINAPQLYLASQLLWDADQDPDDLLQEYFTGLYENVSPRMKEFYAVLERKWIKDRVGAWFQGLDTIGERGELDNFDFPAMTEAADLLQQAYAASSGDVRRRVSQIREEFRFSYLIESGYGAATALRGMRLESRADIEHATAAIKTVLSLASQAEKAYRSILMPNPLYQCGWYADGPRFWSRFDQWEDLLWEEIQPQLKGIRDWAEQNPSADASRAMLEALADDLSTIAIRKEPDYRAILINDSHAKPQSR